MVEGCAVVSCHVERPLDDRCWARFAEIQARRPGGFTIAALMRPPDAEAEKSEECWLERAREAAARGPLGHHTHFVGPGHARPSAPGPEHAERVRSEAAWLRERGLSPRLFCAGGWYMDAGVAEALADLGYADCSATAFRPAYLPDGALRLSASGPTWLTLPGGKRLLELPTTHSLGRVARAALGRDPGAPVVHAYFHDTDLLSRRRRLALIAALALLARRRRPTSLALLADEAAVDAPETPFHEAASGRPRREGQ